MRSKCTKGNALSSCLSKVSTFTTDEAREAAGQLRRAANGLRSNYRAARKGRSRKEFAAKLGTASEEADESVDWLEYLRDGRIKHDPALLQEATELAKIMAKAYRTSKRNNEGNGSRT